MLKNYLESFKNTVLDIAFPNHCIICNNNLEYKKNSPKSICINCVKASLDYIHTSGYILCEKCGAIIENETSNCKRCAEQTFHFDLLKSMLFYSKNTVKLIHEMKFKHRYFICHDFAYMLINFYKDYIKTQDIILSVPIGKHRLKDRGYNQSEIIASIIAKKLNIEFYQDIIYKSKDTKSLSSAFSTQERRNIIQNAFMINDRYLKHLEDKRLLIIDDVFTTGTTVNELSRILREYSSCNNINILTVAKAH